MTTCCAATMDGMPARAPHLEEREATVLGTLAREGDATIAFQGLRHRLGLHQQILTRTLRRLESDGLVAKSEAGYRVTEDGFGTLAAVARAKWARGSASGDACVPGAGASCGRGEVLPVMHVLLPPHADADALADALKGRWFKDLRWFGEVRHADEITLTWIVTASSKPSKSRARRALLVPSGDVLVRVRIAGGAVAVEAESDDEGNDHAFLAAPALLGALADAFGKTNGAARTAAS